MGRPSKPVAVLKGEKKSHFTKAELDARENAESALLSGKKLQERAEVKNNKKAHAEFVRVNKLMKSINKNDALYSASINTYCLLYSEILALENDKKELESIISEIRDKFKAIDENDVEIDDIIAYEKSLTRLISQKLGISSQIDKKRRMMLNIDKENVMTISAALRSIPKAPEKVENPLLALLQDDE